MKYALVLATLCLTACGTSPERRALQRKAFLSQHKAFASDTARPRAKLRTLASEGANQCEQAVNPLIAQAKAAIGDLDDVTNGANQTLNAATGGNAAAIAAMLAAAAAQQQNGQPAQTAPVTNAPGGLVQPSVVAPVAGGAVTAPELGSGGFAPSPHPPTPGDGVAGTPSPGRGGGSGGDNTIAQVGSGPRDGIVGGVTGGTGGGNSRDTITGGTVRGGGGNDAIVGQVQPSGTAERTEFARTNIGSLATDGGSGSGGGTMNFAAPASGDGLVPDSALAHRQPASATRVAGLASAKDVATQYGPGIFSLTTQTYSRFCVRQNLGVCSGL